MDFLDIGLSVFFIWSFLLSTCFPINDLYFFSVSVWVSVFLSVNCIFPMQCQCCLLLWIHISFILAFVFIFFILNGIYLFLAALGLWCCVRAFSDCSEQGPLSGCPGFSREAQALGYRLNDCGTWRGLVALQHVEPSGARNWTHVPCNAR